MSTTLNDLHADGIAVKIEQEGDSRTGFTGWAVDVQYTSDDGKYEDGEYLAGYTGLTTEDDAEFLARAFIAGYKLGKKQSEKESK